MWKIWLDNLAGVLGSEGLVWVFYCSSDGSEQQFASGKIHFQILFMWQEIHQGTSKCETHILLFTAISHEHKHVSDLSMLVFCFCGHTIVVYLRTTKVHNGSIFKELTLHFILQKSHPWNPPSPSEILKAIRGIGNWIFSGIAHCSVLDCRERVSAL